MPKLKAAGKRTLTSLDAVRPNDWNPNKVPPHKFESIKHSMRKDGWLESQLILVWGSDERGRKKNIIIDGEHRWRAGIEVGFTKVPMVFLSNIDKATAKALTVKLDNNRGSFDNDSLSALLRDLIPNLKVEDPAASLGFTQEEVNKMLALPAIDLDASGRGVGSGKGNDEGGGPGEITSKNAVTKQVPLYMDAADDAKFSEQVQAIIKAHSLENVTEAAVFAVTHVFEGLHNG